MQKLENRIAVLEATSAPVNNMTIIRRFVSPGGCDGEIYRLRDNYGTLWKRRPGETEQELIGRASFEVRRNVMGLARLIACDEQG